MVDNGADVVDDDDDVNAINDLARSTCIAADNS